MGLVPTWSTRPTAISDYIKEHNPIRFNGELWTYLADLNEQAQIRLELIIEQMKAYEGATEGMKQND